MERTKILMIKRSTRVWCKKPFNIDEIDVDKILVYKRESYDKKGSLEYFTGHNDNNV